MSLSSLKSKLPSLTAFRLRRGGVSGGSDSVTSGVSDDPVKVYPKTPTQMAHIKKGLQACHLFHNFEEALLHEIIDSLEPYSVKPGTEVITQGDAGDYFWVVSTGKYQVSKHMTDESTENTTIDEEGNPVRPTRQSIDIRDSARESPADLPQRRARVSQRERPALQPARKNVVLALVQAPASFGELALLYNSPRSSTVLAVTDGELWRVKRDAFRSIIYRSSSALRLRFLRQVPVLSRITENQLTRVVDHLTKIDVKPGMKVTPDSLLFIVEGSIILSGAWKEVKNRPILAGMRDAGAATSTLQKFSFFGDRELVTGDGGFIYTAGSGGAQLLRMSPEMVPMLEPELKDLLKFTVLRSIPLMKDVKSAQLLTVVDRFKLVTKKAGETIVPVGVEGTHFYINCCGRMDVIVDSKKVVSLESQTAVGELSLLSDELTTADVVASTDVQLLALSREDFNTMLGPLKEIIANEFKRAVVKKVKLLQLLSDFEIDALVQACRLERYHDGQVVITEGEVGNTFYMMKSGQVCVTKSERLLTTLGEGAFFGERALIGDEPRSSTVTAVGTVECFIIDRENFTKHLGSLEDMMAAHALQMDRARDEKQLTLESLEQIGILGSGAFGLVSLVKDNMHTGRTYALKAINKKYVLDTKMGRSLEREVSVLKKTEHPMVTRLVNTFRDEKCVYMLMDPLMGGELFVHLGNAESFPEPQARFYTACVLLAFNHLHSDNIIYRDLKLENLLLDDKGYCKLVDFGFAKQLDEKDEKAYTLCGTPEYLAPEMIKGVGHDRGCDLWSLGILIYEMLHGFTPFAADDDSMIFHGILNGSVEFDSSVSKTARDLIVALLDRNPKTRLGNGKLGCKAIMDHAWFAGLNWAHLEREKLKAPFLPYIDGEDDTSNFDEANFTLHNANNVVCADPTLDTLFATF